MSITLIITVITVIVSYMCFNNPSLKAKLSHHPYSVQQNNEYYRWITSGLVHNSWLHLGINMFVFYQFGETLEMFLTSPNYFGPTIGPFVFLLFYLVAIMASDLPFYAKHKDNPYKSSVGASGAVSAVLFAVMLFAPWQLIYLYGIIPIYYLVAGVLYLGYETYAHNKNKQGDNTNHLAHIFGAVFGILGLIALKPSMAGFYLDNVLSFPI